MALGQALKRASAAPLNLALDATPHRIVRNERFVQEVACVRARGLARERREGQRKSGHAVEPIFLSWPFRKCGKLKPIKGLSGTRRITQWVRQNLSRKRW